MQAMRGSSPPMLAVAASASHDQDVARLRRATDIHEGGGSFNDIADACGPDHLAVASADFFDVMAECSLNQIEFLSLLNDQRLSGPSCPLPSAGVAIAEGGLA